MRVDRFQICADGWNPLERAIVEEHRWWPVAELQATTEVFYPEKIVELLRQFG